MDLRRRAFLLASFATLFASSRKANATTLRPLSLDELVRGSGLIAIGRPIAKECVWADYGGGRRIVTRTRFVHEELWLERGNPGYEKNETFAESTIVTLGGTIGRIAQKVPGEAIIRDGESQLVFLSTAVAHGRVVVGMGQGHYRLATFGKTRRLVGSAHLHFAGTKGARFGLTLLSDLTTDAARALVAESAR